MDVEIFYVHNVTFNVFNFARVRFPCISVAMRKTKFYFGNDN